MAPTPTGNSRPPSTMPPSSVVPSPAPTGAEKEYVVSLSVNMITDASAREALNSNGTAENIAFRSGIAASIEAVDNWKSVFDVDAQLVSRRRLASGSTSIGCALVVAAGTTDRAEADANLDNFTESLKDELVSNIVESSTFVDAMVASLSAMGATGSPLANATVDVNATREAIEDVVANTNSDAPTMAPTVDSSSSKKSSSDDSLIIIIVCVVGGAVLLGLAGAAVFMMSKSSKVTPETAVGGSSK